MKNIFLLLSLILICLQTNAQQNNSFACGLENFIAAARDKDPDYDKKMVEQEKLRSQWKNKDHKTTANVLTIPVVVHVVWNTITDSISVAQVASQIAVLNTDYMRLNADTSNTPSAFLPISANPKIQFCLAQTDPQGNPTNGITYKKTAKTSFAIVSGDTSIWHTVKGGYDGWDPSNYLNIWVADFGPLGGAGFWPGAVFAGHRQGVIVNHTFFGTTGSAIAPYNLGRTATHEIGHFLDLHHLWGDGGNNSSCTATDFCGDTPTQVAASQNCPTFPKTDACTNSAPGLNFMNFMDYPQDACRNMFTVDQVARMRACLEGGPRSSLLTSTVCSIASGVNEKLKTNTISIFPNPASHTIHVANISELSNIKLYDALGKIALELKAEQDLSIDVSSLAKGIYTLAIENKTGNVFRKVILAK
ncbi:MAG: T9SS type A sorting domain-containing protein [Bacteroidia bacterium]|nr:T9SS type A sorting domain-containing protein [Bacteroidia bacterium]